MIMYKKYKKMAHVIDMCTKNEEKVQSEKKTKETGNEARIKKHQMYIKVCEDVERR